ncbi:MAG: DUF5916 domain-containing protein, partial [Gemmatimonadales bacterium]
MLRRSYTALILLALAPGALAAQSQQPPNGTAAGTDLEPVNVPSEIRAVRIESSAPSVDGWLDDEAWLHVPPLAQLVQKEPVEGALPSESTEVRFAYDDRALYVAFRAYDRQPERVYGRLQRRDGRTASDQLTLYIDSYYDQRTSYEFQLNPSGARRDVFIYNDGGGQDDSWDPVYDWATQKDSVGWTAELRIPFSQLRFPSRDSLVFGIRVQRMINRRNEELNWPFFRRDQVGEASQYGDLVGIQGIPSPRRVEVVPYTAAATEFSPAEEANPFATGRRSDVRLGGDLKYGLTSGLTLDATVNPDFGQVEADAAEVNLTEFESFFPERRPFFVEGTDLFRFGLNPVVRSRFPGGGGGGGGGRGAEGLVFTRRIGRPPQVGVDPAGGYADHLGQTTILTAAKVSGQISGGWAVGLLQAFTAKEHVHTVDSASAEGESAVEPFTSYTVLRAQRNVSEGQLVYGAIGTGAIRDMNEPQFNELHRNAFTGGADIYYRFGGDRYEMSAAVLGSRVEGDAQAILETQMSSARYYQRPDKTHTTLDSSRTSLGGYAGNFRIAKVLGFVTWEGRWVTRSPGFETNDLGFLRRADLHEERVEVNLRWLRPGTVFRRFEIELSQNAEWTYGWERTQTGVDTRVSGDFHNFWNLSLSADRSFSSLSATLLRGGPAFREPGNWRFSVNGRTDFRRPVWLRAGIRHEREDASNSREWSPNVGVGIRPPGPFSLTVGLRFNKSTTDRQYVLSETPADSTYYVFGRLDRTEYSTNWRVDLAITPRLSLELYAEPFISHGEYLSFKVVRDPKAEDYGARFDPLEADRLQRPVDGGDIAVDADRDGSTDFSFEEPNFKVVSFRTNAVVRWEFRPG